MSNRLFFSLFIFYFLLATNVTAHEARPIFIQINETGKNQFTVQWKIPTSIPEFDLPSVVMPETCRATNEVIKVRYPDSFVGQQGYACEQGLSRQTLGIHFPLINPSVTTLFQVYLQNGEQYTRILKPGVEQWTVPEQETTWGVAKEYLQLGMQHIFTGIDHLLFVACLMFIARTGRRILITITGFTLAHSLTLALSTLRIVELPVPPVEAMIALSIIFLAHEIAVNNQQSWTWRYPISVSSSFGLLHGFGFAAVLRAIGLPQTELPAALLFFNVGVEIGQIIFVCVVAVLFLIGKHLRVQQLVSYRQKTITQLASYVIGSIASFWFVERVMGFWG